eukprot:762667-Hanusia_phi.AAC.9
MEWEGGGAGEVERRVVTCFLHRIGEDTAADGGERDALELLLHAHRTIEDEPRAIAGALPYWRAPGWTGTRTRGASRLLPPCPRHLSQTGWGRRYG